MVTSVVFLFDSLMTPNKFLYETNFNFDRIFFFEVFLSFFGLIATVAAA